MMYQLNYNVHYTKHFLTSDQSYYNRTPYMGSILVWTEYLYGLHAYMGSILAWAPYICRLHAYMGSILAWAPLLHGILQLTTDEHLEIFYFE